MAPPHIVPVVAAPHSPASLDPTKQEDQITPTAPSSSASPSPPYSIDKFLALQNYIRTASVWRVVWTLGTTPLYGLVCALIPSIVPQQDPLDPGGIFANSGYMINAYVLSAIVFAGAFTHWRVGVGLPDHVYSQRQAVCAALAGAAWHFGFSMILATAWRFPIPMSWIVVSSMTSVSMGFGHLVVFRQRLWKDKELTERMKLYIPAMNIQSLQILIYPAFSVLFDRVTTIYQVVLTLCFPLLKHFLKRLLRRHTRELKDFSTEVAVSGIEICASLYQSMILQNSPSQIATAIIMGVDVVQGLVTVKLFMDRPTNGTVRHLIVQEALKEIEGIPSRTGTSSGSSSVAPSHDATKVDESATASPTAMSTSVTQALTLVNAAESVLLVEYLEVAIPLLNGIFVAISCQFDGAQYNTRLRHLYFHPEALTQAMQSIALYSFLQALSFVAMHLVMKYRYGLSATYHLAFLLERHHLSIVGKMVGWLPIILHFTGVHYGVDFSFRFDFAAILNDPKYS